jgi:hypothetical protein
MGYIVMANVKPVTEIELSWAAGFLDARGHVDSSQMSMTHHTRGTLVRFSRIVGAGKVYGPYRLGYMWSIKSKLARRTVAERLWPYVATRRRRRLLGVMKDGVM